MGGSSKTPSAAHLVYSTATGRLCPQCQRAVADCVCRVQAKAQPTGTASGPVRVGRQTQGRGGKGVTVITGLSLAPAALESLARELKARCGSGGRIVQGVIEIQGEHRDTVVAELARRGLSAKRAGG
jgi:translation initiation factor 1